MKIKFYSALVLLTTWLATDAQKVSMQFGQAVPLPGNAYFYHLVYADAQYAYVFYPDNRASRSDAPSLSKIDKAGNVVYTRKLDLNNKKIYVITVLPVKDKLYIVYVQPHDKASQLVFQELNDNADMVGEKKIMYEGTDFGTAEFVQSADRTKFGFCIKVAPAVGNGRVTRSLLATKADDLELHVFDSELKETAKGFARKRDPNEIQEYSFTLTNNGELFVTSHFIGTKPNRVVLTSADNHELYDYAVSYFVVTRIAATGQKEVTPFKGDKSLLSMNVFSGDNNELFISGFYGDVGKAMIAGMFSSKFDVDETNFSPLTYKEPDDNTAKAISLSGGKLSLVSGIVVPGGAYVISEVIGKGSNTTSEVRQAMLVTIISADGNISKQIVVNKYQEEDDPRDKYCSFLAFKSSSEMCLLFSDNGNEAGSDDKKPKKEHSWSESAVVLARFNSEGLISRSILYHNKDLGALFEPLSAIQVGEVEQHSIAVVGAQLTLGFSKYKYYIGRITF